MMVPAAAVDPTLTALVPLLERDDVAIDGGNSYYHDDIRRDAELKPKGIHYVNVGTSGGVWGWERGYCLMIGGEAAVVQRLDPSLPPWLRLSSRPRARLVGRRRAAPPSTATCTAGRPAPATSSRWSTMGSNTASWPPTRKG